MSLDADEPVERDHERLDFLVAERVEQAIEGTRLAVRPHCTFCKADCAEGERVTLYCYRPAGDPCWEAARLYCTECSRHEVHQPSRTVFEAVCAARIAATSDVATQSHSPSLLAVDALDLSPATEGTRL